MFLECDGRNTKHMWKHNKHNYKTLKSKLNWSASTGISELILEGNYEDSELDTISKLFLDNCTRVTDLDSLPATITFKNFQGKISKWKESTSTSPSGRHLGHYKSLFARIDTKLSADQQKELQNKQLDIANLYVSMIDIHIHGGNKLPT